MASDKSIIDDALAQFQLAVDAESENRQLALEDKQFAKLGGKHQWPEKVWQAREADNRPCLTINRMPQFLKQVINDQRMNKPSITVRPVDDSADIVTARIFQGLIRNIEVSSNADKAYDMAFDDAVSMGFGFFRIVTEYAHDSTFEQDIRIKGVENAFTVYLDPDDLFNPKFGFVTDMVKRDVFKKKYGIDPKPVPTGGAGEAMQKWYDKDAVRVAEYWRIEEQKKKLLLLSDGSTVYAEQFNQALAAQYQITVSRERDVMCPSVKQYMMTGQELVGEPIDWAGKWIPIIPVLGESINIEGKRHLQGLIRHAKDPQRNFNFWRSASTELVALAPKMPFVGAVGQFDTDADKWARANEKSYAYLQYDAVDGAPPPMRQGFAGVPAGALQEAMNASDDMKSVMGLYDASLGNRSNETSGIAIQTRQREGDVSTFNFMDGFARDSLTHAGRILIDLIPKVYDTQRVVRIIGSDDQPEVVRINQMFMGQDGKAVNYDLSTGKYDVVVKVGPSFSTQREEVRTSMLDFIKMYPPAAPLLGPLLAKNMDWPESEKVAQMLQGLLPPAAQGQDPQRQQMEQHIQQLTQQMQQLQGDKALEARKLDIDAYGKETDRLKVTQAMMTPQDVQAIVMQSLQQILGSPDVLPGAPPQGPMPQMQGPAEEAQEQPMPPDPAQQQVPPQEPPPGGFSLPG